MANQTGVAVTIADMAGAATQMGKYVRAGLTVLAQESELSDILPFLNLGGQVSAVVPRPNPDTMGAVYYRNLDGKYTWTKSSIESFTEPTELLTYAFKIDTVTNNNPAYTLFKPGPYNMEILGQNWARELVDSMINGDPTANYGNDPDGFATRRPPGIRYRLDSTLNGIDNNLKLDSSTYGGAAIDLTAATSSTIANNFVDMVNESISLTNADFIIMNYRMRTLAQRQLRVGGMFATTSDSYGRKEITWGPGGPKILTVDLKAGARTLRNLADTTQWIMPYENALGVPTPTAAAGARFGSMYFVHASSTDGFTALTQSGMQQRGPEKLPLPEEAVGYSMQMGYGFATLGFRCIARVLNIRIG